MPKRIQMTRNKPWRCDNPNAVIVARPSKWGNPYRVGEPDPFHCEPMSAGDTVFWFKSDFDPAVSENAHALREDVKKELRGRDLACWCPLNQPCHADVLLEIANE